MSAEQKTVVIGMSGGVDSSVAALLLKQAGYKVIGLFMKNWDETNPDGSCTATQDYQDVVKVCEKIDIPYYSIEFIKEYQERVFASFLEELKKGRTPNPDVLCNKEIKFDVFFQKAIELGADYLATGHYCQVAQDASGFHLAKGVDPNKDQSYFLYAVDRSCFSKVLFPIGHLPKPEVRRIAREFDIPTKEKKDSTGICFIGERNFRKFLSEFIQYREGDIVNLKGEKIGQHFGTAFYTIGQRKGLGLGGQGEPWFVLDKDVTNNRLVVERGTTHPGLFASELVANELIWDGPELSKNLPYHCKAKIRYRQPDQECIITKYEGGKVFVHFPTPQRAITPGQSIVFYKDEICLGGAFIDEVCKKS